MATIKDIAHLAGVSQGTVSNVLNGKGIVSSEKIRLVEEAAAQLGYTINERAKILRKGKSKLFALILPNLRFRQYVDFYVSFSNFVENHGYSVLLFISNNNPETELTILSRIRSAMATGVATFSCLPADSSAYTDIGFAEHEVLYVERDRSYACNYIGFDYRACGEALARLALKRHMKSVAVVTDDPSFSHEAQFIEAFDKTIATNSRCVVTHLHTDLFRRHTSAFQVFSSTIPDGICISTYGFAQAVREVWLNFYQGSETSICTVSPIFTMPESNYTKYELNYSLLGRIAAETLADTTRTKASPRKQQLENSGFRNWDDVHVAGGSQGAKKLHVLTIDSPAAVAMQSLSRIYTQTTGTDVNISVFSYEEIHEVLTSMDASSMYDIIRLDVTWLSWFAEKLLVPLEQIYADAPKLLDRFVEGLGTRYSHVGDTLYAMPVSPSNQLLFYRKDLFDSTALKRLYHETYKSSLRQPKTFAEFNQIAEFFTKTVNMQSPVEYGTTTTLGSTGVAATEYLTRYFARTDSLFTPEGKLLLDSEEALLAMQDLIAVKPSAPERYCTWWTNAAQSFAQGNVAMTILYSNFASEIIARDSKVINKIGFAVVPGANPIIGGGSLGVSRYSKHPQQAFDYINWLCNEPLSSAMTLLGSVPACKQSYENYEIVNTYPWLELAKDSFSLSHYQRTPQPNKGRFDERRFLSILGMAVKNAFSGVVSPQEALRSAQTQYEAMAREITAPM